MRESEPFGGWLVMATSSSLACRDAGPDPGPTQCGGRVGARWEDSSNKNPPTLAGGSYRSKLCRARQNLTRIEPISS